MIKHTQTIRRQIADELFECVWPFCEIGSKRVNVSWFGIHDKFLNFHDWTLFYHEHKEIKINDNRKK